MLKDSVVISTNLPDTLSVIINEFLTDLPIGSAGDVNGDGIRNVDDDQFIEIVNKDSVDINLSGWKLSNNSGNNIIYTFPGGSILPPRRTVVVFGGGNPSGNFGDAIIQTAKKLSLKKSFGEITLLDGEGNITQHISYGDEAAGRQSLTRNPEITGAFVRHASVEQSRDALFSPGTKVDGSVFGSKYAMGIWGNPGWRMVSSPVKDATFQKLLGDFGMQGINESKKPSGATTVYSWREAQGGTFMPLTGMAEPMESGKGYIVYFAKDDEPKSPGIQGGFPKLVSSNSEGNNDIVTIAVSATDANGKNGIDGSEGWNLLGNPFGSNISASAVIDVLGGASSSINTNIYVWDQTAGNGNGAFAEITKEDIIAPFQAFFVRYIADNINDKVSFSKNELTDNTSTQYDKQLPNTESVFKVGIELHGKSYFDTYFIEFNDEGSVGLDNYDGYKLFSLNSNSINLYSTIGTNELQKNVLPRELKSTIEIPLLFDAKARESLTFSWDDLENVPSTWDVFLMDNKRNRKINLRVQNIYSFNRDITVQKSTNVISKKDTLLNKSIVANVANDNPRFVLSFRPTIGRNDENKAVKSVALKPNYPNPFNSGSGTTIPFDLDENADVTLTVWNMIGQKIATLINGQPRKKGANEERWNAVNLPSGLYIARLEADGKIYIRKMTLIK